MTELEVFQQSLRISQVALVVTVLISTVTIVFGILSMAFQRSHNRKSVKPFCNIEGRRSAHGVSVLVSNAGLGPMLITRIQLVPQRRAAGVARRDLAKVLPDVPGCRHYVDQCIEHVLPPQAERTVFECAWKSPAEKRATLAAILPLRGSSLVVRYSDVYDHEYEKSVTLDRCL